MLEEEAPKKDMLLLFVILLYVISQIIDPDLFQKENLIRNNKRNNKNNDFTKKAFPPRVNGKSFFYIFFSKYYAHNKNFASLNWSFSFNCEKFEPAAHKQSRLSKHSSSRHRFKLGK